MIDIVKRSTENKERNNYQNRENENVERSVRMCKLFKNLPAGY